MLKHEIEYEDFDGNKVSEIFYFNISKPELLELEVEFEGGFGQMLQKIIESKDAKSIVTVFKRIVLLAYGKKSDDGKRFIKSEELKEEFSQTAAYQTLFIDLAQDDKKAVMFLQGVLPKDMVVTQDQDKPNVTQLAPPPVPTS